jgi:hypothetical protein
MAAPGKLIVHYGMPKTGSSSIRASFYKRLADPRFHYVDLGEANASYGVATGFKTNPGSFHVHLRKGTPAEALKKLKHAAIEGLVAELHRAGEKTAFMSAEAMSGLKEPEIRDFLEVVRRHRSEVRFVGYIRRPKESAESVFQQGIKAGQRQEFKVTNEISKVRNLVERLDAVFGKGNADIWLFDPSSFPGKCVVQDICARLGIEFAPEKVRRVNEGITLPAVQLLYAYRKLGPGFGIGDNVAKENRLLVQRVRMLEGPKLRFHSSIVAPLIKRHRADVEWVQERLGVSLAENLAANDEQAVRTEQDLLRFPPESLRWLAAQLGPEYEKALHADMSPRQVAEWMHRLRLNLVAADPALHQSAVPAGSPAAQAPEAFLKLNDLIESAARSEPRLAQLSKEDARNLVRGALVQIRDEIRGTREGSIDVAALGQFLVSLQKAEENGQKGPAQHIAFEPVVDPRAQ